MVLKKQTVWLLTMLSLVIVLSVYYITSPGDQYALMTNEEDQQNAEEQSVNGEESMNGAEIAIEELEDGSYVSSTSTDELLTQLRLQIDEQRAKLTEELQSVAASVDVTAEQKSEALDKIQQLHNVSTKEKVLETLIRADENYADVLVKAEGEEVIVIVKAKEKSKQAANEIMQMVRDEMGQKMVRVEFQPIS